MVKQLRYILPLLSQWRALHSSSTFSAKRMAKSKFEYVKEFELSDRCLPNAWIVVRIDGKGFHKFSDQHQFAKPNDMPALKLMSAAAQKVMDEFNEICIAYGQSDEYSFVFRKKTECYNRRASKLMTNVVSKFAASYVYLWTEFMGEKKLLYPPAFDSRVVLYPTNENLRDYLSWRQVDCHINNLHNTCFWGLVQQSGMTTKQADQRLRGTLSGEKNELLYSEFNINYNNEPEIFKKGTVLVREKVKEAVVVQVPAEDGESMEEKTFSKRVSLVTALHTDIIKAPFWKEHPTILGEET